MPFYVTSPFRPTPKLMVQGTPEYLLGSFPTDNGPTLGYVISDAAVTTTGTVTFQITSGNIPLVNDLITIVGTTNSGGVFNVTNAVILTVSAAANPDTGVYTVTFAITSTAQAATPDYGQVIIPRSEVGEALTTTVSTAPVVSPVAGPNSVGKSLSVTVKLPASTTANPSTLTGVTANLQGANFDLDSEYNTIGVIGTGLAAGTTTDWQSGQGVNDDTSGLLSGSSVNLPNFRFYRINFSAVTGSGPAIAKMLQ